MIYWDNFKYIMKHKYHVMRECFRLGEYWLGITHDISKFEWGEYKAYAKSFYSEKRTQKIRNKFDYAWLHHQNSNKHHWQYWVLQYDDGSYEALIMPKKYETEMIADWVGAGIVINGKNEVYDWYQKNKDKMILNPVTRISVESRLERYKKR